jgi:ATP-binding cassette, subfamily B, bacterial PglK
MIDTFRRIFWLVGRDNPRRWVSVGAGAVVASGLEMMGAVLIYLLLALIVAPAGEFAVPVLGDLWRFGAGLDESSFLLAAAAALGVFFLLRALYFAVFGYVKHRLAQNAAERVSTQLADGYLRMPYAFHLRRRSSELVRNAHHSVEELAERAFLSVIQVIAEFLVIVGLLVVMLIIAPLATGVAIGIVGTAAGLLLSVVQPRLRKLGAEAEEARQGTLASLQQSLHGIRDVQVLGAGPRFVSRYRSNRQQLARALYLRGAIIELPRLVIETSLMAFILLLFAWSIVGGAVAEQLLSTLGLFAYAGLRIQPSLQKLVSGLNAVKFSGAAVRHVQEDLALVEGLDREAATSEGCTFNRTLQFEGVSFTYEGAETPALQDVNLEIRAGEVIGICGPTGGGKTTLTDLITGLLDPTDGHVTVDQTELRACRPAWFAKLGVVPQVVFLVDDTIRQNIALASNDDQIVEERLAEAVEVAQLGEFVGGLPEGLDTVVGERGVRISGGQRQRIAIARALYRAPEVLIFDEGTSALDDATEAALLSALDRLRGRSTVIMVAHRLASIKRSDRVLQVLAGRVSIADPGEILGPAGHPPAAHDLARFRPGEDVATDDPQMR